MLELKIARVFDDLHPVGSGGGVTAIERTRFGMAAVMVRRGQSGELLRRVEQHYGITLADAPMRCGSDRLSFIGTGNGKWLAVCENPAPDFIAGLRRAFEGSASVADQSHACGVLRLSGPALLATLEKGVRIDLSPDAFPVGRAAVTQIAHLGVTLWKVDDAPPIFDIAVARSVAGNFSHWLQASAGVHGLAIAGGTESGPEN